MCDETVLRSKGVEVSEDLLCERTVHSNPLREIWMRHGSLKKKERKDSTSRSLSEHQHSLLISASPLLREHTA